MNKLEHKKADFIVFFLVFLAILFSPEGKNSTNYVAAIFSIGIFYVLITSKFYLLDKIWYITLLSFFAILHVLIVFLVDIPPIIGPGIQVLPFVMGDGLFMFITITIIEKVVQK